VTPHRPPARPIPAKPPRTINTTFVAGVYSRAFPCPCQHTTGVCPIYLDQFYRWLAVEWDKARLAGPDVPNPYRKENER